MRVDEAIASATTLLGQEITVEGHLVTDFHSCAYLAPDAGRRRRMGDSLGITTGGTDRNTLWHRSPVGASLNTVDDFFAMSPVFHGQAVVARVFITGTLLRTDDARFPFTLERITQVFAHAEAFGCTLVYKPANSFERAGFSDMPTTRVTDVLDRRGYYDHMQVRLSGAVTGNGEHIYLVNPSLSSEPVEADHVQTIEMMAVPDLTGEFPTYVPRYAGSEAEINQAVKLPHIDLFQQLLPTLHNNLTDIQVIGTVTLDNAYPFPVQIDNLQTVAIPQGGGVIAVWNLPRLMRRL